MRRLVVLLLLILSIVSLAAFFGLPWFAFGSDTSTAWTNFQWAFTEQGNRLYAVMAFMPLATIITLILLAMARIGKVISSDLLMLMNGLALLPFAYYYYDLLTTYNQQQQKLFNPVDHIQLGFWLHVGLVGLVFLMTIVFAMQPQTDPMPSTEKNELGVPQTQSEQVA